MWANLLTLLLILLGDFVQNDEKEVFEVYDFFRETPHVYGNQKPKPPVWHVAVSNLKDHSKKHFIQPFDGLFFILIIQNV